MRLPWELKSWDDTVAKFTAPITSIVDMDMKMAQSYRDLKPRLVADLFGLYYRTEMKDRVEMPELMDVVLPYMQKLLAGADRLFRGFNATISAPGNIVISRRRAATILSALFFGLFEYSYYPKAIAKNYPTVTLAGVFKKQNIFALQCLLGYFRRGALAVSVDDGIIIIKRSVQFDHVDWRNSAAPICELFMGDGPHADDSPAKMHIANAHQFIGGSMFSQNLSQEEVILLIRPECLLAPLFCEKLQDYETITVFGAEKFTQYSGYGASVQYVSGHVDLSPVKQGPEPILQVAIVFMDASARVDFKSQFIDDFERDLLKAYCGFDSLKIPGEYVASGNWTYDFKGNNIRLKFLQLLLAASQANKRLIYHSFGMEFESALVPFIDWVQRTKPTVGTLFKKYISVIAKSGQISKLGDLDIFDKMMDL